MKKHAIRIGLGILLVALFLPHAAKWYELPLIGRLESIIYDTRLNLTMPRSVDSRIVIVDIDEKSLAEREKGGEGHWPWPRDRLALMLNELFDHYQVAVAGFDVVFSERDQSSGLAVLQDLGQHELHSIGAFQTALKNLQPKLDYDRIFADSLRNRAVVLGYVFTHAIGEGTSKGVLPPPVLSVGTFGGKPIAFPKYTSHTANLEELQQAAAGSGYFSVEPDDDGILRRVPMLAEYDGAYYEPLSLAVVRLALGNPAVVPGYAEKSWNRHYAGLEWLDVGPLRIPVDEHVSALIPYRGHAGSFRYVSAVDVIHERAPLTDLKGKIVLIGTTAPGLLDLRATPVGAVFPGVEVHANMIAGMLDGNIKQKPAYVVGAEFLTLLVAGITLAFLLPLLAPLRALWVTMGVVLLLIVINLVVFQFGNLILPLASELVLVVAIFIINAFYGFLIEERAGRRVKAVFGQYVPPEVAEEMANSRNPEQYSMAPRAENLTVLFSDVRGFTTISEMLSPEDLAVYINEYLTTMSLVIRERHRGTLDKYVGDAIMAFWGAPVANPRHAQDAVLAALDMMKEARALNEKFKARGWPTFKIGIGVNSGTMRVGDMGSQIRRAYTVMGDAVNLGSRLEGITKEYGADIIVGETTRDAAPDVVFRELDRVRVKGKDEAVAIYEPLGLQGQVDKHRLEESKIYSQFLRLYRQQEWEQAEVQLLNLQRLVPDNALYSQAFVERIAYLRANPPGANWDGAFTFKTK